MLRFWKEKQVSINQLANPWWKKVLLMQVLGPAKWLGLKQEESVKHVFLIHKLWVDSYVSSVTVSQVWKIQQWAAQAVAFGLSRRRKAQEWKDQRGKPLGWSHQALAPKAVGLSWHLSDPKSPASGCFLASHQEECWWWTLGINWPCSSA